MRKVNNILIFLISILFLSSCATQKNCIETNNFCGIIVDENNKPVKDFMIICYKNAFNKKIAYTNSNGIFILPEMSVGDYIITGKKENYGKIENKKVFFNGNSYIFCCQVQSITKLLEQTKESIRQKNYDKALEIINATEVCENELNSLLVLLYKTYLYIKLKDWESYSKCIKLLKQNNNDLCKKLLGDKEICL